MKINTAERNGDTDPVSNIFSCLIQGFSSIGQGDGRWHLRQLLPCQNNSWALPFDSPSNRSLPIPTSRRTVGNSSGWHRNNLSPIMGSPELTISISTVKANGNSQWTVCWHLIPKKIIYSFISFRSSRWPLWRPYLSLVKKREIAEIKYHNIPVLCGYLISKYTLKKKKELLQILNRNRELNIISWINETVSYQIQKDDFSLRPVTYYADSW